MIHIRFDGFDTPEWREWLEDCEAAQRDHDARILAGHPSEADSRKYGRLKKTHFLNPDGPFHGKCVFCDEKIRSTQHGDVEHFRPKAAVVDLATKKPLGLASSGDRHPGYYWLAYDWRNLIPACQLCNEPSTEPGGESIGKRNYFPLADESTRAQAKAQEVNEAPLLIHPVLEDPADHLGVDPSGVIYAVNESPRGQACIDIFGLNLRTLPDDRAEVFDETRRFFKALVDARHSRADNLPQLEQKLDRIKNGEVRHAAAARIAIAVAKQELLAAIEGI